MKKSLFTLVLAFSYHFSLAQTILESSEVQSFQNELNESFKNPATSPLIKEDLENFDSLEFYPFDNQFNVPATFVRTPFETPFEMPTTTERKPLYVKYGEVYFKLKENQYKLSVYQNLELTTKPEYVDYLFIPFTDLTSGKSSYSGGRYLDLVIPDKNMINLDFNRAYNPYCAYNGKYSCPIPPQENHLNIEITAGVKAYENK